mgnify:CR=1 FL=1|tara:strand:+ start:371976 stop:373274 length:1299 start_codon:yes stop_codon:yes gene_type:complete
MNKIKYLLVAFLGLIAFNSIAQQTPADAQTEAITITGAVAHLGNGTVIENSIIVFENGKLTTVADATNSSTSTKGKVIDASGKHVYPGFITANSSLGLVEVNSVRASDDQDEIGELIPHIRSLIAYNAESKVVESMRPNGILIAQVSPKGGRISGTSSIMQFDAWNWEDAAIKVDDGIHLNWPNSFSRGGRGFGGPRELSPNKNYTKEIDELKSFMLEAKTYGKGSKTIKNLPYEATLGLFDGSQKLYIHADGEKEITDGVNFAKSIGINNIVIIGGYDSYKVIGLLKKNNVAVLTSRTHSNPNSEDDDYDFTYKLPKMLSDSGILVGIQTGDDSNFQTRNLPFYAGQVASRGLDKEDALKLITSNTAKILGIDTDYGTLEVGKSATLFISDGDALDMKTNVLSHAFIDGRAISLESHQTELYKRYKKKLGE